MFYLVGLPEGLVGSATVTADSVEEVFEKHPALKEIRSKLVIEGNRIIGFAPCDG